jgi:translation initiation factor 1
MKNSHYPMNNTESNSRLVYSTSLGRVSPEAAKPVVSKTDGIVRLRYETKGRKGKGMTLITGLPLSQEKLLDLSKQFKQRFGTGGTVKKYTFELQGDFREEAAQELRRMSYEVKF